MLNKSIKKNQKNWGKLLKTSQNSLKMMLKAAVTIQKNLVMNPTIHTLLLQEKKVYKSDEWFEWYVFTLRGQSKICSTLSWSS